MSTQKTTKQKLCTYFMGYIPCEAFGLHGSTSKACHLALFPDKRSVSWLDLYQGYRETIFTADSRLAPSQWEMSLQSNAISHWLGTNLESALILTLALGWLMITMQKWTCLWQKKKILTWIFIYGFICPSVLRWHWIIFKRELKFFFFWKSVASHIKILGCYML